jgi:transposase
LKNFSYPRCGVIMDNLGSHKSKAVRALITGAKLFFLPKYSPDLNPIGQVFAKLKHFLRKAAAEPPKPSAHRSAKSGTFTPEECANYFKNSGDRPT